MVTSIPVLAWIAAAEGRFERAARLLGVVHAERTAIGTELAGYGNFMSYHEECGAACRTALGATAFAGAFAEGAAMPQAEALAFALEEHPPGGAHPDVVTADATRAPDRRARRPGPEQQGDRGRARDRSADRRGAHRAHPEQAGFHSRTQIVAWVNERGETKGDTGPAE